MKEIYEYIISILILLMFIPVYSYIVNALYRPPAPSTPQSAAFSILYDAAYGYSAAPLDYYQDDEQLENYVTHMINNYNQYGYRVELHPRGILWAGVGGDRTYVSLTDVGTLRIYYIDDSGDVYGKRRILDEPANKSIYTPGAVAAILIYETGKYNSIYPALSIEAVHAYIYGVEQGDVIVETPVMADTAQPARILFYFGDGDYDVIEYTPVYIGINNGLYTYRFETSSGSVLSAPGHAAVALWMISVDGRVIVATPYPVHAWAGAERPPATAVHDETVIRVGLFSYIVEAYVWRQGL